MSSNTQISQSNIENNIVSSLIDSVVNDLQKIDRYVVNQKNDDIYSTMQSMGYDVARAKEIRAWNKNYRKKAIATKALINVLQKMINEYTEEQKSTIQNYIEQKIKEMGLIQTANPEFLVSKDGKYYSIDQEKFKERNEILNVDSEGHYTVQEKLGINGDRLVTTYNMEGRPIILKILNKANEVYPGELDVVKKLNLKREYVNRYKLHGYSGNSSGFCAAICNKILAPMPTGYYFDQSYNFFKWNKVRKQFEVQLRQGAQPGAPMLADYDFKANKVVRTDYDGAGLINID